MKKSNRFKWILVGIIILILGVILGFSYMQNDISKQKLDNSSEHKIQNTQIANPASVNCIDVGGELEIRENELGQYGVCIKDEKECEEWALFRGECELFGKEDIVFECVQNSDCVPASCCHSNSCVSKDYAPECNGIMCSMQCQPGSLDCGQGSCGCVNNKCSVIFS